ncbi:MAG: sigma-70 family RNA polymerase sigma factor [Planctomycetaceae bacterium]|nr:sigma-70 family RNA polymerase sigma factor [Planctomycetaceae bacterium]
MTTPCQSSDHDSNGLFARARAGDQAAWEELFRTCYPKVVRVVRRKLDRPMRSLYDSTDFASDVMKSLMANLDRLDFPSMDCLMSFLAQVAEQKVIDEYRRRHTLKRDVSRERALVTDDGTDLSPLVLASADPTPSQVAQADEVRERLLAGQEEPERVIIELKLQNYSNAEIAVKTGWNLRRVQRFFEKLQDTLWRPGENR